jgi:large subunit ribosomal protein L18
MKQVTLDRTIRRKRRVSENVYGTKNRPRIVVFRSNRYIYVQAVDDVTKKTLAAFSSLKMARDKGYKKGKKVNEAKEVGKMLAGKMIEKGIKTGILDRSFYSYKGRVKALAEGLREGGLNI